MGWYDALKDLGKLADGIKDAELHKLIATLRMEGAQLAEDLARLREEDLQLREQLSLEESLLFEDNLYWKRARGGSREGPFCPHCYPQEGKAVRMIEKRNTHFNDFYRGPVCDLRVKDAHGTPTQPLTPQGPSYNF